MNLEIEFWRNALAISCGMIYFNLVILLMITNWMCKFWSSGHRSGRTGSDRKKLVVLSIGETTCVSFRCFIFELRIISLIRRGIIWKLLPVFFLEVLQSLISVFKLILVFSSDQVFADFHIYLAEVKRTGDWNHVM